MGCQLKKAEQEIRLSRISEGVHVEGRKVHMTKYEFERLCGKYDEGSCKSQCGLWHRMEKQIISLQNRESEGYDETKLRCLTKTISVRTAEDKLKL